MRAARLWGLSMALHEGSEFVKGQPKDTNLHTYTPLRMGDVPEIEIEFSQARKRRLASASRPRPRSHPRSGMRSLPRRAHASVTCQSVRKQCGKRSRVGPDSPSTARQAS